MEKILKDAATTRDRILHATLKIIGKEGFQSITIKKIADLAEVNIAAVNYHFGSKTNVINEAMKVLNKKLIKCFEVLENKEISPEERLRSFLLSYMERALEYPDIFRNFIYRTINECGENSDYVGFLKKEGIEKIKRALKEAGAKAENEELSMKMLQMISSIELPILLGKHMNQLSGIDFDHEEIRVKYTEMILKSLLS